MGKKSRRSKPAKAPAAAAEGGVHAGADGCIDEEGWKFVLASAEKMKSGGQAVMNAINALEPSKRPEWNCNEVARAGKAEVLASVFDYGTGIQWYTLRTLGLSFVSDEQPEIEMTFPAEFLSTFRELLQDLILLAQMGRLEKFSVGRLVSAVRFGFTYEIREVPLAKFAPVWDVHRIPRRHEVPRHRDPHAPSKPLGSTRARASREHARSFALADDEIARAKICAQILRPIAAREALSSS